MLLLKICVIFCVISSVVSQYNYTFTYNMAMRCKEHLSRQGYKYDTFYRVDEGDRRQKSDPSLLLEMHIAIVAPSNGHILLSTVPHPTADDPVYEIVVGGGGNKFTELRRNLRKNSKGSFPTPKILSAIDFRAFYIKISEDGNVEFGKEGDLLPIISYQDMNPISVNYFSFASWHGIEAKFLYDCPPPGEKKNDVTPNSQPLDPMVSGTDRLLRTLLMGRDPSLMPSTDITVRLDLQATSVSYDVIESKLTVGLSIITTWRDDGMAWNPAKFNGTTKLKLRRGQIWSPRFYVVNSDSIGILDSITPEPINVASSGDATFYFQTRANAWCTEEKSHNTWPHDEYTCPLVIRSWERHEKITIDEVDSSNRLLRLQNSMKEMVVNEWEAIFRRNIVNSTFYNELVGDESDAYSSDTYILTIRLKRRATVYDIVLYTPLSVLMIFLLLSFWTERLTFSRVWFYACMAIVICMGLCSIDYLVPTSVIPSILILYTTVLGGVLLALLVHTLMMTSTAAKLSQSALVSNMLTNSFFRTVFCLSILKGCKNYNQINDINEEGAVNDDEAPVAILQKNGSVEEMQTDQVEYSEKHEITEVLDKIMFFIYTVVFSIMLALHF